MAVEGELSLQVSAKGDSICIFNGDTALIEAEIRSAMSHLEQSSEAQHEKELYQLLLRALRVNNRDELISFLEDCARQNPALAAKVSYELEDCKEVSGLISILKTVDDTEDGTSITQRSQLQGAANIAHLLREISDTEFKARQFSIRYYLTPWYKLSFSDYFQRFRIWFNEIQYRFAQWLGKPAQGSIWRYTYQDYTWQYNDLEQDAKDTLQSLFQETSAELPSEQYIVRINPSLLRQIQMKWLHKYELRQVVAMKNSISTKSYFEIQLLNEAGRWDVFVGDKALFCFETLLYMTDYLCWSNSSKGDVARLMTIAREIGLLSGRSEDERRALFDQILTTSELGRKSSWEIINFVAFEEDIFCCQGVELQQAQTLFLTLLSSEASTISIVNRMRNSDEPEFFKKILSCNSVGSRANLVALLRSPPGKEHYVCHGLKDLEEKYDDHPVLKAACRDAIARAGGNAQCVASALKLDSNLLGYQHEGNPDLGSDAQKNIDTIVAAGNKADFVAKLLRWALKCGLLAEKGDDVRKAILQHVDKIYSRRVDEFEQLQSTLFCTDQESLFLVFKTLLEVEWPGALVSGLGLLNRSRSMLKLDDLRTIFAMRKLEQCCAAIAVACPLYQHFDESAVSGQQNVAWDRVKEKIIARFKEQDCSNTGSLFHLISQYPSVLDQKLLEKTLTKDDARCGKIHSALSKLETRGTHFLTRDNYDLLLEENNDPVLLAKVLCGDLEDSPNLLALSKLSVFSGLVVPEKIGTDSCFNLYKKLIAMPGLFSINVLRGLLQLSIADQVWLLDVMKNNSAVDAQRLQWLFDKPQSAVAYIMAQMYVLHQRYQIVSRERTAIRGPNDWESSMRDDYVNLAKERLDALSRFKPADDTQLEDTEVKIREMLLQAIVDERPLMTNQPEQNARYDERVRFIQDNQSALARRADMELISQAVHSKI